MKREAGALLALLLLAAFLTAAAPRGATGSIFLTAGNLTNILTQVCVIAILAAGASLVIFSGGIDLSAGSLLAWGAALAAGALKSGWPVPAAAALGIAAGGALGLVNGGLVTACSLPPFIATLGMMGIARGFTYVYLGGAPLFSFPESFRMLAEGRAAGVPVPVWIMLAVYAGGHLLMEHTRFGRAILAMGGNPEAARLSGLPVGRQKAAVYGLAGCLAGLSGLLLAARLDSAEPQAADGYELDAIAAVVMGGGSLAGGEGTMAGTLIGALIMGVVRNGLNLLNVSAYWQKSAIGAVILIAVLVDVARRKRA